MNIDEAYPSKYIKESDLQGRPRVLTIANGLCQFALAGDVNDDCRFDLSDFAMMAATWLLDCGLTPGDPACIPK